MMLVDPPTSFSSRSEWREFLVEMEAVALARPEDAELARHYIKLAKTELGLSESDRRFKCPKCKQTTGADIIYGFPTEEAFEQAERNEAVLGGCMQEIGAPDRQCLSCGQQWEIVRRGRGGSATKRAPVSRE